MNRTTTAMLHDIATAFDLAPAPVAFADAPPLPSAFAVSALAGAALGAAGLALAQLVAAGGAPMPAVRVDMRRAALWFGFTLVPQGWALPSPWDALAGDYRARDGWIKLHTNAPHHRAAALAVLGTPPARAAVAAAVAGHDAEALEAAIIAAGGCAAMLRRRADWLAHPAGAALAAAPLAAGDGTPAPSPWRPDPARPLAGVRVLDVTRVLAGPVATRLLAGYGAEVLRLDPPDWDEPGVVPEVTAGKRCARLDLKTTAGRARFAELLAGADVLVHGLRGDALARLGFDAAARQAIRPGLIDVSHTAYGHAGPWAHRRGFDSLVQFSAGIADAGARWRGSSAPVSLPVQALDQATGYLVATAVLRALTARLQGHGAVRWRLSLARTAELLFAHPGAADAAVAPAGDADFAPAPEATFWGQARRIAPALEVEGARFGWALPAGPLGAADPRWAA